MKMRNIQCSAMQVWHTIVVKVDGNQRKVEKLFTVLRT